MLQKKRSLTKFYFTAFIGLVYVFLYLPIVMLAVFSFNDSATSTRWVGFTFKWYRALLDNPELIESFKTSILVACGSTIFSVSLGMCLVLASKWWKSKLLFDIYYPNILMPEIVLAIGILSIFVFFKMPLGYTSLITGHTLLGLGFVIPIIRARFAELDPVLTEASLDLGATYSQTLRRIYIPLLAPSILASSLLVFTISLDDFLISFFCSSPSVQPLSVYVFALARSGIDPTINAISAIFLVISSLVVLLLSVLGVAEQVL
jgi:spermidine/putrescine transport system permease protein